MKTDRKQRILLWRLEEVTPMDGTIIAYARSGGNGILISVPVIILYLFSGSDSCRQRMWSFATVAARTRDRFRDLPSDDSLRSYTYAIIRQQCAAIKANDPSATSTISS